MLRRNRTILRQGSDIIEENKFARTKQFLHIQNKKVLTCEKSQELLRFLKKKSIFAAVVKLPNVFFIFVAVGDSYASQTANTGDSSEELENRNSDK